MNVNFSDDEVLHAIAAVKRGIDLLDRHFGGDAWAGDIDLEVLEMGDERYCILGQLFGRYWSGKRVLGIMNESGAHYGFDNTRIYACDLEESWDVLNEIWASYLTQAPLTINDIEVKW